MNDENAKETEKLTETFPVKITLAQRHLINTTARRLGYTNPSSFARFAILEYLDNLEDRVAERQINIEALGILENMIEIRKYYSQVIQELKNLLKAKGILIPAELLKKPQKAITASKNLIEAIKRIKEMDLTNLRD